ncbi:hypothetical protein RQM59_08365 [Flavobacteriaceae bacterium S356]|uniref:Uncharacterized protein n=1 Tax=Asprobacillus argus TaxID=3076534 RepID=A0ABU3LFA5_9FLAO|nr:hypothetical protein [Flavobacteriaceae bacterium S356]
MKRIIYKPLHVIDEMNNKKKLKELENRIDETLFYVWDPIGISNEPCARGEYSSYTMTILKYTLTEDLTKIAEILSKIESDSMGLSPNRKHNEKVAERLVEFKIAVENELR